MGKHMNESEKEKKSAKIQEWTKKGAQWCAEQLWLSRRQSEERQDSIRRLRLSADEKEPIIRSLQATNRIMAKVIHDRKGIKPRQLMVNYVDGRCEAPEDYECWHDCEFCDYGKAHNCVGTFSFYTLEIDDGNLTGITSKFEYANLTVTRVIDMETNEVLYFKETEGNEEGDADA